MLIPREKDAHPSGKGCSAPGERILSPRETTTRASPFWKSILRSQTRREPQGGKSRAVLQLGFYCNREGAAEGPNAKGKRALHNREKATPEPRENPGTTAREPAAPRGRTKSGLLHKLQQGEAVGIGPCKQSSPLKCKPPVEAPALLGLPKQLRCTRRARAGSQENTAALGRNEKGGLLC